MIVPANFILPDIGVHASIDEMRQYVQRMSRAWTGTQEEYDNWALGIARAHCEAMAEKIKLADRRQAPVSTSS